jgi:hypothetical protein
VPDYRALYPVGTRVRVIGVAELEAFRASWKLHHRLAADQLQFADREAIVIEVSYYHGGDVLYRLDLAPNQYWHEVCLAVMPVAV